MNGFGQIGKPIALIFDEKWSIMEKFPLQLQVGEC